MFQYDGSQYNQLTPNSSNTSINSTQLGGVDSTMYATKEYVDGKDTKYLKTIKGTYTGNGSDTVIINYEIKPKMIFICSNSPDKKDASYGAATILADNVCCVSYGAFKNSFGIYLSNCVWENNRVRIDSNYLINYSTIEYIYIMAY